MLQNDPTVGPVAVLRMLDAGKITSSDAIRWAERQLDSDVPWKSNPLVLDLVWLPYSDDSLPTIIRLLEQLIDETIDFSITSEELKVAEDFARIIVSNGHAGSITDENCILFLLGRCPCIAPGLAKERRNRQGHSPGLYTELRVFSYFIIEEVRDSGPNLADIASVLEMLYELGDLDIQNAITVGVLEGVCYSCGHSGIDTTAFRQLLLPKAMQNFDSI